MPKRVIVEVPSELLRETLNIGNADIHIEATQLNFSTYGAPTLQLVLSGEDLDDRFETRPGSTIRRGKIVVTRTAVQVNIIPLDNVS